MSNPKYSQTSETSEKQRRNHYSHAKMDARKNKRRVEAEVRQEVHDKLSIPQQIELAKSRRGESKRELARLQKKLESTSLKIQSDTLVGEVSVPDLLKKLNPYKKKKAKKSTRKE